MFGKILTAMVTPFNEDLEIDWENVKKLTEHLIENGTDTIVVAGTTGESPTLTKEEKLLLFQAVKKQANGRVKVIANAGNNNTKETVEFIKEIEELDVADGIMVVNPYYNKPSQEGLYHHFKSAAEATNKPVMLYNIPGRTSVNLKAETAIRLSKIKNIVALKESSGDLSQIATIIQHTNDFYVYSGDDNLTLPILSVGGHGVVSVASHAVGLKMKEMMEYFSKGEVKKAAEIHRNLLPFFEGIFFQTNPVPIKTILNKMDVETGGVRLPLVNLSEEELLTVEKLMELIVPV